MSRAYMPLYVGDYLRDTRRLSTLQHGIYLLLIMDYWANGGLPEDDQSLARIAGLTPEQWQCERNAIAFLFGPKWRHKRIDAELEKVRNKSAKAAESASNRWKYKQKTKDAFANRTQCVGNARARVPEPEPDSKKKKILQKESFDRFYEAYPKRVNRQAAVRKFEAAVKSGVDPEKLISAACRYAVACQTEKTERRFIKAPDVWLNKGCYDDEISPNGHDPPPKKVSVEESERRWQEIFERGDFT